VVITLSTKQDKSKVLPKGAVPASPAQPQPSPIQVKLGKLNTMFQLFVSEMNETIQMLMQEIAAKDAQIQKLQPPKESPK
jgi:hypothetical protein